MSNGGNYNANSESRWNGQEFNENHRKPRDVAYKSPINENFETEDGAPYNKQFSEVKEFSELSHAVSGVRRRSEGTELERSGPYNDSSNQRSYFPGEKLPPPRMTRAVSEMHHRPKTRPVLQSLSQSTNDFGMPPISSNNEMTEDVREEPSDVSEPYPSMRNPGQQQAAYSPAAGHSDTPPRRSSSIIQNSRPPKKEATPIMPPSVAAEPSMPRPRVSRRFLQYTQQIRQVDFAIAESVNNTNAGDIGRRILKCQSCFSILSIPKMAVMMQCPVCGAVCPATSSS